MLSIWFLLALVLAAPMYAVWQIRRFGKRELCDSVPSAPQPSIPLELIPETKAQPTRLFQVKHEREVQWGSIRQFMKVFKEHKDIIVVDLRPDEQRMLSPVPAAFVLPVWPDELVSV
jgi:hypothetical protein